MGKRKIYVKTDLCIPHAVQRHTTIESPIITQEKVPPINTCISFGRNATTKRHFDFSNWYGLSIDAITYACQKQIERFLAGQDAEVETSTLTQYCRGLSYFLDYLVLYASASDCEINLKDINRDIIEGYLRHLAGQGVVRSTQKNRYAPVKSVLQALKRRGVIVSPAACDTEIFPRNPFPNCIHLYKGETPLTKRQRQAFAEAVKSAVTPIWHDEVPLTSETLIYALLIVALHTGRNTTPLLEMRRDCLRPHPRDDTTFLVLWKRRGHNSNKVVLRADSPHERLLESTPIVRTNVERLILRVIDRTEQLRTEAPEDLSSRVWLYRSRSIKDKGKVRALSPGNLEKAIQKLVYNYNLIDIDGQPLRINISRLRKTFANRIFELLDGDLTTTAIALGNTPNVAGRNYLLPDKSAKQNWRFMGEILVKELLEFNIGATYKTTPLGRCGISQIPQPPAELRDATCINFLNCVRCRNYAVTADDLYKLFSFYFRVFAERTHMDKRRWAREYAHIPRLIDDYIVAEGLRRGVFQLADVEANKHRARIEPHPFWSSDILIDLEAFS